MGALTILRSAAALGAQGRQMPSLNDSQKGGYVCADMYG